MASPSLKLWTKRASAQVESKVADARAHASKALTESLKATPDGRQTARRAKRNPSSLAAQRRLAELLDELVGPQAFGVSQGLIREARESLYREAFTRWMKEIPQALRLPTESPTESQIAAARGLVLHGLDLRQELAPRFERLKTFLASAIVLAGARDATAKSKVDLLKAWEQAAVRDLNQSVALALGDSAVALDRIAGRDLIHPELLDDSALEGT